MASNHFLKRLYFCGLATLVVCAATRLLAAEPAEKTRPEAPPKPKFVRVELDPAGKPVALQTAITRFVPTDPRKKGLTVDLVAVVHVGDKRYYEACNKEFEAYDAVLYELVAPPGARVEKGVRPSNHPISVIQNAIKDVLKLDHQLEDIDYNMANMIHADMSPDEFTQSMKDRGESFWTLFFRLMGESWLRESKTNANGATSDYDLLMALFDKDRALALKRAMSGQIGDLDGGLLSGEEGSTIITERNKVALKEMDRQIAAGKKHIAIFFGAGHMADFEKRLTTAHGLKRASERWLTAWDLHDGGEKPAAAGK
jgi:hypothetical protein